MRRKQKAAGYTEVNTPQVLDRALWETSGHWQTYRENMFVTKTEDERVFAIKPMNCPGHVQIFKNGLKSYRDLPVKIAEFGVVHRYEPSGALHGMMRVRAFTQDDAHIFCSEDQIMEEALKINDLILTIYRDFGFDDVVVKLSTRPEKRVGSDEHGTRRKRRLGACWKNSASAVSRRASRKAKARSTGRSSNTCCATPSAANGNAARRRSTSICRPRFGAFYIDADSGEEDAGHGASRHVRLARALHRHLIEHYAGHLPLWLSPLQIVICTITQEADDYAYEVAATARKLGMNVDVDARNEKITYKVREHSLAKVPVLLVAGKKEAAERTISMRRLGSQQQTQMGIDEALKLLGDEATPPDVRG